MFPAKLQWNLAECLPVGLLREAEFTTAHPRLSPGDTLVLYSDGVTEAETPSGDPFGVNQLLKVVAHNASNSVKELQAAIVAAVHEFTAGADQADDITLVVIRYEG